MSTIWLKILPYIAALLMVAGAQAYDAIGK